MKLFYNFRAIPKGRPRLSHRAIYTDPKTRSFEERVRNLTTAELGFGFVPLEQDLKVKIVFGFKKKQRVDLDNLIKSVCDALNKVLYRDDCQIMQISAKKVFKEEDFFSVEVKIL